MKKDILEADSIWLEYGGRKILQNIYVRLETGAITGLLGRNGAGKSCLMQVMFGSRSAENRSVRLNGQYLKKAYPHSGLVAYLPQKHFVPAGMTVRQAFSLYAASFESLELFFPDILPTTSQTFGRLSGGQRRLWETLLILASPCRFVLLDEPFSNLSPVLVERLRAFLLSVKTEKGILLSDHYYRDVLALSDQLYLLTGGRTVAIQEPDRQLVDFGYLRD